MEYRPSLCLLLKLAYGASYGLAYGSSPTMLQSILPPTSNRLRERPTAALCLIRNQCYDTRTGSCYLSRYGGYG